MIEDEEDARMMEEMLEGMRDLYRLGFASDEDMQEMEDLVKPFRKTARIERAELEAETKPTQPSSPKQARL
jgi:hypothetical protein